MLLIIIGVDDTLCCYHFIMMLLLLAVGTFQQPSTADGPRPAPRIAPVRDASRVPYLSP